MTGSGTAAVVNKEPATAASITSDVAMNAAGVRERYLCALAELATAVSGHILSAPLLQAFFRLNAAYYLESYLPAAVYAGAVDQAIIALTDARRELEPCASGSWARIAALLRRADEATGVQRLLGATERHDGDLHTLIAAQHTLEVLPDLPVSLRSGLLASVEKYAVGAVPSAETGLRRQRRNQQQTDGDEEQLRCWAQQNARPPREHELFAWVRCISRREPQLVLTQALASGLAFGSLVDALIATAAMQALQLPGRESGFLLVAAHAVRRLSELGGRPAIGAWLDLAGRLSGRLQLSEASGYSGGRDPRELALVAVRSGDPRLIQVAEVALVESESLPRELSPLLPQALSRLLAANTIDD